MEKAELIINIRSLLDSIESSLKKECVNKIPDVEKFICIKIDDSFNPFLFRDLITSIPQETEEIMDYITFCNYVHRILCSGASSSAKYSGNYHGTDAGKKTKGSLSEL